MSIVIRFAPTSMTAAQYDETRRRLEESGLDVVNLQEVWGRRALAVIRAQLPSFPYVAWRRGVHGQPAGGLVTFSRRPVGAVSYTSFHGAPPDAGGIPFRVRRAVNSLLQGVLTVELVGLGTVVANTHLTANKDGDWSAGNRYHALQRRQVGWCMPRFVEPAGPTPS